MIEFVQPNVVFDETAHTYTNENGKLLSGVTSLLKRQLFSDKYGGISEETLARAAERGNLIHRQIEMYESLGGGEATTPELEAYIKLKEENGFNVVATELLVSDEENVASSIDIVFEKILRLFLVDVKTTSSLDMEYLSWQLSIYKYLFLLKNPTAKVRGLFAIWLPKPQYGKPKIVAVEEKPMSWVKELIETDARGEKYVSPEAALIAEKQQSLVVPQEVISSIADLLKAEKVAKDMKERLKDLMEQHGIKKWECEDFIATYTPPGKTSKFDSAAFKADHPELYEQYVKESDRKASIRTTLR